MFGVMWGGAGLLLFSMSFMVKKSSSQQLQDFHNKKINAVSRARSTPEDIQILLGRYLDEIFPTVFHAESYFRRLTNEIVKHHRYLLLFSSKGDDLHATTMKRIVTCAHLLTIQTLLMFMLAVLYDLQVYSPSS
jgi:hypothetical protein